MVENNASETAHPAMDMKAHRDGFAGFAEFTKTATVGCLNAVVCLAYVYKQMPVTSVIFLIALLITAMIGLMMKSNGWIPGAIVMVLGLFGMAVL